MEGKLQVHDREINTLCWTDDIVMFTKEDNTLREMIEPLGNTQMKINWK